MDANWLWVVVTAVFLGVEGWALAMRHDKLQPATYWLRKLPWLVRAGVLVWLCQHFMFWEWP